MKLVDKLRNALSHIQFKNQDPTLCVDDLVQPVSRGFFSFHQMHERF